MKVVKTSALIVSLLVVAGSAWAALPDLAIDPPIKIDPPPIRVPETGSTLLMLGLAVAAVEGFRRWADRKSKR